MVAMRVFSDFRDMGKGDQYLFTKNFQGDHIKGGEYFIIGGDYRQMEAFFFKFRKAPMLFANRDETGGFTGHVVGIVF
jgi:hypothetical protein